MKFILIVIAIFAIIAELHCQQQSTAGTNMQTLPVLQKNSQIETNSKPASVEMLKRYAQNPDLFDANELNSIALGYLYQTNQQQAIVVLERLLKKEPNNVTTIRRLGQCYLLNKQPEVAIDLLKKSSKMGDEKSVLTLGEIYCYAANYGELKSIIPTIIQIQKSTKDIDEKHDAAVVVLAFLLNTDRTDDGKKMLFQSLDSISDDFVVSHNDLSCLAIQVLQKYQQTNRVNQLQWKLDRLHEK